MEKERQFICPVTGDMNPESFFHRENIDLATVIEAVEVDGLIGFEIRVDHIERMMVRHPSVFLIFRWFCESLEEAAEETKDDEEKLFLRQTEAYVCEQMLKNINQMKEEIRNSFNKRKAH